MILLNKLNKLIFTERFYCDFLDTDYWNTLNFLVSIYDSPIKRAIQFQPHFISKENIP